MRGIASTSTWEGGFCQGERASDESCGDRARHPGPFSDRARARDRWNNGEQVPAWVKVECCGPNDAHHLRPDQVRRNADGDFVVDIYPDPIPARMALPSQDGDYWLFFYNDYGFYGSIRCFFVPALF